MVKVYLRRVLWRINVILSRLSSIECLLPRSDARTAIWEESDPASLSLYTGDCAIIGRDYEVGDAVRQK